MSTNSDSRWPAVEPQPFNSVVSATGLGKRYRLGKEQKSPRIADYLREIATPWRRRPEEEEEAIWALDRISFEVAGGERVGVIGRNGAGKSTLLKILSRVSAPSVGEARIRGRLTSLLEVGTGFNDNLTGRENVFLNAALYGLAREEIRERFDRIVDFSEVRRFIDTPVKAYSSGMKMRLAFAVAAHLDPDILLLDEVLAVGDMAFQQKCLEKVDDMTSGGRTLFFVSHSMDAVIRYCDRCIWLDRGRIRMDGGTTEVVSAYVEAVLGVKSRTHIEPNAKAASEAIPPRPPTPTVDVGSEAGARPDAVAAAPVANGSDDASAPTRDDQIHTVVSPEATAFLKSGWISDAMNAEKTVFRVDEPVFVHFEYAVTTAALYVPAIHVHCPQGTLAFVSCPADARLEKFRAEGQASFRAIVEVPSHLLNIGTYRVSLVVFSPDESPFKRHFAAEQALAFHCVEAAPGQLSARGFMPRGFPGPVRPLLAWQVEDAGRSDDPDAPLLSVPNGRPLDIANDERWFERHEIDESVLTLVRRRHPTE